MAIAHSCLAALQRTGEATDTYRQFTGGELIIKAMRKRETEVGHGARLPIPEAKWLAALQKGAKVQMIKRPQCTLGHFWREPAPF